MFGGLLDAQGFARLLAGAVARAGSEPRQHVAFRVQDATGARGLEVARAGALEAVLLQRVAGNTEKVSNLVGAKRAVLGGVVEDRAPLLEGQGVGLHGQRL